MTPHVPPSENYLLITFIVLQVLTFAGALLKFAYEVNKRRQDREDRKLELQAEIQKLELAGKNREKRIVKEVQETKKVAIQSVKDNKEAIRVANGHNEKITTTLGEIKALREEGLPVVVVNDETHPVHTTGGKQS